MLTDLTPGKQCVYREKVVEIDGAISSAMVAARDIATGELLEVDVSDLRPLRAREAPNDARFVSQYKWDKALVLAQAFAPIVENCGVLSVAECECIAQRAGVSTRTVRRRFKRFLRGLRTSDLLPGSGGRPEGTRLCAPDVETIVSQCIQTHYLNRQAPTIAYLMEQVEAECRAQQLRPPARSTVTRRIDTITVFERLRRRKGLAAAKQASEPRPGQLVAEKPLAIVQIDHTRCDVMLVADDEQREVIGRPWLTVAIDVYSRCILGFLLTFDAPSATSVALCLESAILPKATWLATQGLDASWPMYGKPIVLLLDNGADFHGQALRRGCEEFGISLQYRPVKQPHYGAHIERLLGTFMHRVHLVPGTTFSNPRDRGDYNSAKRAVMTLHEFRDWLIDQVTRWYHVRPHRGLDGLTPSQVWEAGWRDGDKATVPPVVASPIELRAAFFPVAWRKIQRTGLELWGLRYWHEALAPLIGSDERICIRYDPRDIRGVLVRGPDGLLLEVPVVSQLRAALSLAEHRVLRRQRRERGRAPELLAIRDDGARRTAESIQSATKKTRAARRRRATAEQRNLDGTAVAPPVIAEPAQNEFVDFLPPFEAVAEIWRSSGEEEGAR